MSEPLKILFVDDRGLGIEQTAASLFALRGSKLGEAVSISLAARGDGSPAAGASFDVVITLCDDARRAVLAEPDANGAGGVPWLCGVPALLHWPIPSAASPARDRLRVLIDELVDHGTLDALRRERGLMQSFADMMDEGIVIHDKSRRVFFVNRAATELTGTSRERILGRDCHEAFPPRGLCGAACQFCGGESSDESRHASVRAGRSPVIR